MKSVVKEIDGKSGVEWLLVMLLLVLFASGIFMLSASTSDAYKRIQNSGDDDAKLRTAMSYISTKVKQNDREEALQVVQRMDMDTPSLVIREVLLGETYETWIYFSEGELREATIAENGKLTNDMSFIITELSGFNVEALEKNVLKFSFELENRPSKTLEIFLDGGEEVSNEK